MAKVFLAKLPNVKVGGPKNWDSFFTAVVSILQVDATAYLIVFFSHATYFLISFKFYAKYKFEITGTLFAAKNSFAYALFWIVASMLIL